MTVALLLAALLVPVAAVQAAPFVPARDDEVVEHLRPRTDAAAQARRAALARDPRQLPLALATAREAIDRARREGDPRDLGVAQAALAPWWTDADAPAAVRLLRATLLQSRHDFDGALLDLDRLVGEVGAPSALRAQALLTRATVLQVRGRFADAAASCEALLHPSGTTVDEAARLVAQACLIELRSLTGDPRRAMADLQALAGTRDPRRPDAWLALLCAELAERLGDDSAAHRHFQTAAAGGDVYALAAFADWLLDRRRETEALDVLAQGPAQADALLLRRAIAWHRLGDTQADAAVRSLRERFAAARVRGDAPHLREEGRLALDVDGDAPRALALAQQQWVIQREPADAVLLWRAAQKAGAPEAAKVLQAWLAHPAIADVRLRDLPGSQG
jgi:hypothetical protein